MTELSWLQLLILASIQGLSEFLPVSSSAHLQLPRILLGWSDQGLLFDVVVHAGTLLAVIAFFRNWLWQLICAGTASLTGTRSDNSQLAWMLVIATLPAVAAGLLLGELAETTFRSPLVIAINTILFALVLWYADLRAKSGHRPLDIYAIGWQIALLIGCAQALALIPGVSRSGIVLSAALLVGMKRRAAAQFTFLLALPVIAGATILKSFDLREIISVQLAGQLLMAFAFSAFTAFLCIKIFLAVIDRIGILPFVIYRLILGMVLLAVIL